MNCYREFLLTTILVSLVSLPLLADALYLKGGMDIFTKLKLETEIRDIGLETEAEENIHVTPNFHFELEYGRRIYRSFSAGLGICYEGEPRAQRNFESKGFSVVPLYGIAKYSFLRRPDFVTNLVARVGYGFVAETNEEMAGFEERWGGFYYGVGVILEELVGVPIIWEVCYTVSGANFEREEGAKEIEHEYTYSKLCFTIGKRFDL